MMKMKFNPLRDIVLIKKTAQETVSAGGIAVLGGLGETVTKATVVAAGPGFIAEQNGVFIPTTVKEGDSIIVPLDCGRQINLPGYDGAYHIIRECEIAGVMTE